MFSLKEKLDPYYLNSRIRPKRDLSYFFKPSKIFEAIVIDTPPALNLLTTISLIAATHVIIPIHPSYFCLQGIDDLLTFYGVTKEKYNSTLSLLGYLINNIDFMSDLDKEVEKVLRMNVCNIFSSVIQRNTIIENAIMSGQSLATYSRNNHAALELRWEFIEVFREIEERIKSNIPRYNMGDK